MVRHQLPLPGARAGPGHRLHGSTPPSRSPSSREALALGLRARPVLVGPVTFLAAGQARRRAPAGFEPLDLLDRLLPVYAEVLAELRAAGAEWVQLDEPALVTRPHAGELDAVARAYRAARRRRRPAQAAGRLVLRPARRRAAGRSAAPVDGLAPRLHRPGRGQPRALAAVGGLPGKRLVAGVVDGRNIWLTDLERALATLGTLLGLAGRGRRRRRPARCCTCRSTSTAERDSTRRSGAGWPSPGRRSPRSVAPGPRAGRRRERDRPASSPRTAPSCSSGPPRRSPPTRPCAPGPPRSPAPTGAAPQPYAERARRSATRSACRCCRPPPSARSRRPPSCARPAPSSRRGELDRPATRRACGPRSPASIAAPGGGGPGRARARRARAQRHGRSTSPSSSTGFLATEHGWVQSLRHPLRAPADPRRRRLPPRADDRALDAVRAVPDRPAGQGHAHRSGHHAGLVVRPRRPAARRHRPAGRAGPARRGRRPGGGRASDDPGRRAGAARDACRCGPASRPAYLAWAVEAFRLATAGGAPDTQIHTHMCYAEFGDILEAIDDLDADVISLEAARSHMQVAAELARRRLPARGRARRLRHPLAARAAASTRSTACSEGAAAHPRRRGSG